MNPLLCLSACQNQSFPIRQLPVRISTLPGMNCLLAHFELDLPRLYLSLRMTVYILALFDRAFDRQPIRNRNLFLQCIESTSFFSFHWLILSKFPLPLI